MSPERSTNHENEPWLFVNKDAESYHLSRSHQREKFLIHSHVQGRWRRRKARQSEVADQSGEDGEGQGHEKPEDTGLPEGNVVGSTPFIAFRIQKDRSPKRHRLTDSSSCLDKVDAFEAFPVHLDADIHRLLQFYQHFYHDIMWCRPQSEGNVPCCISMSGFLHECFTNPVAMFATLASMCTFKNESLPREANLIYTQRAVAELRKALNGPLAEAQLDKLVFAICMLSYLEISRFDMDASAVHLRGAKALIGWKPERIGSETKNLVQKCGVLTTWGMIQSARGDAQKDIPVLILSDLERTSGTQNTLLSDRYRDFISSELQSAIESVANLAGQLEREYVGGAELGPTTSRRLYVDNKAADMKLALFTPETPQDSVVLFAVKIWKAYAFPWSVSAVPALSLASNLAKLLERHPLSLWEDHVDGLMWVLTIGAMTSADMNTLVVTPEQPERDREQVEEYFLQGIATILRRKDAQLLYSRHDNVLSAEGLRSFSRQFLYLDCIQRRRLHLLSAKLRRIMVRLDAPMA